MLAKKLNIKQGVNILWIKPEELDKYWSLVHFMIAEGLKFDGNPMDGKKIKNLIATGEYQLFMMFGSDDGDKYKVFGCFVTRILSLPNFKQVEVILSEFQVPGNYIFGWNAEIYPSGIYFIKMTTGKYINIKKVVLTK